MAQGYWWSCCTCPPNTQPQALNPFPMREGERLYCLELLAGFKSQHRLHVLTHGGCWMVWNCARADAAVEIQIKHPRCLRSGSFSSLALGKLVALPSPPDQGFLWSIVLPSGAPPASGASQPPIASRNAAVPAGDAAQESRAQQGCEMGSRSACCS